MCTAIRFDSTSPMRPREDIGRTTRCVVQPQFPWPARRRSLVDGIGAVRTENARRLLLVQQSREPARQALRVVHFLIEICLGRHRAAGRAWPRYHRRRRQSAQREPSWVSLPSWSYREMTLPQHQPWGATTACAPNECDRSAADVSHDLHALRRSRSPGLVQEPHAVD